MKNVRIMDKTHADVIGRLQAGEIIAIHFPNVLQGFSILAQREQMAGLPGALALCGAIDTAESAVMHADTLFRDFHTPGLDCAAVQWRAPGSSLYFEAYVGQADFDDRVSLGLAHGRSSGGLLFLQ